MSRPVLVILIFLLALSLLLRSPLLFLLDVLLGLLAGATWLWQRYGLSEVSYARRFEQDRLFCGESTTLWVEVVNAKPLPLPWLKADDEFPEKIIVENTDLGQGARPYRQSLTTLLSLRWYERVRRRYHIRTLQRGAYEFGPVFLATGDLFGFRQQHKEVALSSVLLVYPRIVPVVGLEIPAARPGGEFMTERRVLPDPLRLAGVRDYTPGDNFRHIHWKATARRGQLQTKVFDPSAAHQVVIGANGQTLERAFEGNLPDQFELVMTIAASVANAAWEARRPVGFFTNSALRLGNMRVPAARHPAQLTRIFETLAQLTYFTQQPFENALRLEASQLPYGASLILISAILTDPICAALLDLREAGHPVLFIGVGLAPVAWPATLAAVGIRSVFIHEPWQTLETLELA